MICVTFLHVAQVKKHTDIHKKHTDIITSQTAKRCYKICNCLVCMTLQHDKILSSLFFVFWQILR